MSEMYSASLPHDLGEALHHVTANMGFGDQLKTEPGQSHLARQHRRTQARELKPKQFHQRSLGNKLEW